MLRLINNNGLKEYAFMNDNSFSRNHYAKSTDVVSRLENKNKSNHVYTSIYNYANPNLDKSTDVTDADVIFDRLVFDFDFEETNEHILLHNGFNSVELKELSQEEIETEVSKIKELEKERLSECKTENEIQNYYIEKYENNYLLDAYKDCLKVADFFITNFDVEPVIFFSGSKGNHLYILLNNPISIKNVDELVYSIGNTFKTKLGVKTIDENVYSSAKNRLIRLPCSKHQTTKLYNTQIFLSTKYDDMLISSMTKQDINNIVIPNNDTAKLESWLMDYDNTITNEKENKAISDEIKNNDAYVIASDVDIFHDLEFKKNFLKIYKTGSMNSVGYSFAHLCFRSNFNKSDVVNFFENLGIEQDLKKVHSWINRTYSLDININRVGGLNNFLKEVSKSAQNTEHDKLISYFKSIFTRKERITTEVLEPFKIANAPNEYKVTASLTDGEYTEIKVSDILTKGLDFILNLKHNKAYFKANDVEYDFSYKYGANGFAQKNKQEFKEITGLLNDMLNINLDKKVEFSLKTYFSNLYNKLQTKKEVDKKTYIIDAVREQPTNKKLLIELAEFIETDLNIKKTTDGEYYFIENNPKKYSNPTTDILTISKLGYILLNKYNLRLDSENIRTVLNSIHGDIKYDTSRWELGNNYYLETFPKYHVVKYDDPVICNKKLGMEIDNKFVFFEYNPNIKLVNSWEDATLTEKTLRQILIPKRNLKDRNLYIDFLQRLGATFIENNIHKAVTIYYSQTGNNGKSILNNLHRLIFKKDYVGFEPKELKKDIFSTGRIANKNSIWADELTKDSLNGAWDTVKRFSSGLNNVNPRIMYSQDTDTDAKFGMLYLNTNDIPNLPLGDRATLDRADILTPPNRFDILPTAENEYKIDISIGNKLELDFNGLEWLINASIKAYLEMKDNPFKCTQSWKQTLKIIKSDNDLLTYILEHTKIDYVTNTSNAEIYSNFINYCEENNITIDKQENTIKKDIGSVLSEVYRDELIKSENNDRKVQYNIRILSKKEIEEINNAKIIINEYEYPAPNRFKSEIEKTVYDFIKHGQADTISDLRKEFPKQNIKKILKNLKRESLIDTEEIY